jgi:hypothetical protein
VKDQPSSVSSQKPGVAPVRSVNAQATSRIIVTDEIEIQTRAPRKPAGRKKTAKSPTKKVTAPEQKAPATTEAAPAAENTTQE